MKKGTLIALVLGGLFVVSIVFWAIGVSNKEKKLYLAGKAAQQNSEVVFDNTWKVIQGQAGVADKYKDSFKEIYIGIMNARYEKGDGTLMKWIQESNPTFDASLFAKVMNTIEGSREAFTMEQKKLIDIDREHKLYRATFPNSLIVGGRPDLDIKLVTSAKTKAAFSSGEDNDDPNPFGK